MSYCDDIYGLSVAQLTLLSIMLTLCIGRSVPMQAFDILGKDQKTSLGVPDHEEKLAAAEQRAVEVSALRSGGKVVSTADPDAGDSDDDDAAPSPAVRCQANGQTFLYLENLLVREVSRSHTTSCIHHMSRSHKDDG